MGRAVSIPPLNMTPEQLAQALLRPVKPVQDDSESREKQGQDNEVHYGKGDSQVEKSAIVD